MNQTGYIPWEIYLSKYSKIVSNVTAYKLDLQLFFTKLTKEEIDAIMQLYQSILVANAILRLDSARQIISQNSKIINILQIPNRHKLNSLVDPTTGFFSKRATLIQLRGLIELTTLSLGT